MKRLIYIDNDDKRRAEEDVDYVKNNLEYFGKLPSEYVETMEIIPDFGREDKDKMYDLLFSPDNCICTWSMYTATHFGSLYQIIHFLKSASICSVLGKVYIDGSGQLEKSLNREIKESKSAVAVLNAIEENYIISFDTENDSSMHRLRVDFKGYYETYFKHEAIDLNKLLSA